MRNRTSAPHSHQNPRNALTDTFKRPRRVGVRGVVGLVKLPMHSSSRRAQRAPTRGERNGSALSTHTNHVLWELVNVLQRDAESRAVGHAALNFRQVLVGASAWFVLLLT